MWSLLGCKVKRIVDLLYFMHHKVSHSRSSHSAGDRGLAGFQGAKGLL